MGLCGRSDYSRLNPEKACNSLHGNKMRRPRARKFQLENIIQTRQQESTMEL